MPSVGWSSRDWCRALGGEPSAQCGESSQALTYRIIENGVKTIVQWASSQLKSCSNIRNRSTVESSVFVGGQSSWIYLPLHTKLRPREEKNKVMDWLHCNATKDLHMNSEDGQGHKDKYLDTSRKILSQEMLMCNMKALIFIKKIMVPTERITRKCSCEISNLKEYSCEISNL